MPSSGSRLRPAAPLAAVQAGFEIEAPSSANEPREEERAAETSEATLGSGSARVKDTGSERGWFGPVYPQQRVFGQPQHEASP